MVHKLLALIFAHKIALKMTQQYHLSLDTLTNSFFDTLKERLPHAKLDIQVKTSEAFNGLNEKDFGQLLRLSIGLTPKMTPQ